MNITPPNDENTLKGVAQIAFVISYFLFLKTFYPPLFYLISVFMLSFISISFICSFCERGKER